MQKFAFEISGTFDLEENRKAFRIANDNDGTERYGESPQNVIVSRHIDAHSVRCQSDDDDYTPIIKELDCLNPMDLFGVWGVPNTRLSDMMHPLHIALIFKNYLDGDTFISGGYIVRYFGGFSKWLANEIYYRCKDEELPFTMRDCLRYVKACMRLVK